MPIRQGGGWARKGMSFARLKGFTKHPLAPIVHSMQTEGILCQIDFNGSNVHGGPSVA